MDPLKDFLKNGGMIVKTGEKKAKKRKKKKEFKSRGFGKARR